MQQPNILLITTDQHRHDFFQSSAFPSLRTPNMIRLRNQGVTLTNAFSNCPICMPTRFSWWYGLYASQGNKYLLKNAATWPTHLPSMPQALQETGYHTALIGKVHSHTGGTYGHIDEMEAETRARGFHYALEVSGKSIVDQYTCRWANHLESKGLLDSYKADLDERGEKSCGVLEAERPSFLNPEDSCDGFIGKRCRDWLESYDLERPFFLHASFCGPHFPIDPPSTYAERYQAADMPAPAGVNDPELIAKWKERRALYCAMIEHLDDEIGALLDLLENKGWQQHTLVILTTDHGDMMGLHNRGNKCIPYDASSRTPVTLSLPGVLPHGIVLEDMAETVDLPCSILEAVGVERPETKLVGTPGRSYWGYAKGEVDHHRDIAFSESDTGGVWRMARSREWAYIAYEPDGHHPTDELFDMIRDPDQLHNLIDSVDHQQIIRTMQRHLISAMVPIAAPNANHRDFSY